MTTTCQRCGRTGYTLCPCGMAEIRDRPFVAFTTKQQLRAEVTRLRAENDRLRAELGWAATRKSAGGHSPSAAHVGENLDTNGGAK